MSFGIINTKHHKRNQHEEIIVTGDMNETCKNNLTLKDLVLHRYNS